MAGKKRYCTYVSLITRDMFSSCKYHVAPVWQTMRNVNKSMSMNKYLILHKSGMLRSLLEFIKGPVVCGSVLKVLNLYGHHGARERPGVTLFLWLWRQELRGQRRVQSVCQQDKLELDLKERRNRWAGRE